MKKIILILTTGLTISLFASEDFKDKHFKCTLIEKNGEYISERQAESLNEFKIDTLMKKTNLRTHKEFFNFEKIDRGDEIYSYHLYGDVYYKATLKFDELNIKKVITTVYDENYDPSDRDIYFPDGKEYAHKSEKTRIQELKEKDRKNENDQRKYSCTEATFIEKIKYKYDHF